MEGHPLDTLIFYTSTNGPKKPDATGAFIPEAKKLAKIHSVPKDGLIPVPANIPPYKRRRIVIDAINANPGLERVFMLCHGWPRRIQFGVDLNNLRMLTEPLIDSKCGTITMPLDVVIYACSCARNPRINKKAKTFYPARIVTRGSFAHALAIELSAALMNVRVIAHWTAGHTTQNPYVVVFEGREKVDWYIRPYSIHWPYWDRDMKKDPRLRFDFFETDPVGLESVFEKEGGYI